MLEIKMRSGVPYELDADDNPTYEEWMRRIDRLLMRYIGVSVYDLVDCPFIEWYKERLRPIRAANRALAEHIGEA